MSSAIPAAARGLVTLRDRYLCVRCGCLGAELHHRRSRSVLDAHTHCPCLLVLLCRPCHTWVHAHPFMARAHGLIISRYEDQPWTVPAQTMAGSLLMDCMGGFTFAQSPNARA